MHNFDLIERTEPLCFGTYAEFKEWLAINHGENCKGFTAPPIEVIFSGTFDAKWRKADFFQSGLIHYIRR